MIPDAFTTQRLRAERMCQSHFEALRMMHQDVQMMAMIGGVRDAEGSAAYLERHIVHWGERGFGFWMLSEIATGDSVGLAGLRRLQLDGAEEVEVGYGFLPAWWGQGLATEIARRCLDEAYRCLAIPSVVALTSDGNVASQRVLRKVGLSHERDVTQEGRIAMLFRGHRPGAFA